MKINSKEQKKQASRQAGKLGKPVPAVIRGVAVPMVAVVAAEAFLHASRREAALLPALGLPHVQCHARLPAKPFFDKQQKSGASPPQGTRRDLNPQGTTQSPLAGKD